MEHNNNNSGSLPAPASLAASKQKVVLPGQEHTGRWTKEEHEAFLSALQQYGKEWKKVAAKVKTRTVVQTRTHAQKYFQKLNKVLEGDGLDGEGSPQQGPGSLTLGSSSATIMNAQYLASMMEKGKKKASKHQTSPSKKPAKSQQGTNVNTSQLKMQSKPAAVAPSRQSNQSVQPTPRTTSTAEALLNMSAFTGPIDEPCSDAAAVACPGQIYQDINNNTQQYPEQQELTHGFGFPNYITSTLPNPLSLSISIKAPDEDPTKYPEPSPAACGKRKVAEIAAAQMLVGVSEGIDIEGFSPNPLSKRSSFGNGISVVGCAAQDVLADYGFQTEDDAFLAEVFGVDGRAATPPLAEQGDGPTTNAVTSNRASMGSLQIVNPDTLEDTGQIIQKRRCINGQASPSTPWDGQLEALVSHVHQQEAHETNTIEVVRNDGLSRVQTLQIPNTTPLPLRSPITELQHAIYNTSISKVSKFLSTQPLIIKCDDTGYHALHSAAALGIMHCNCNEAVEICRKLIEAGADVLVKDKDGNTALHWAARSGHCGVIKLLLNRNCPIDAQNDSFETALHWAMRAGSRGMVAVQLLVESGARTNLYSSNHKRALDLAAEGFFSLNEDSNKSINGKVAVDQRERRATRWNMQKFSSQCRTLVLHHHECLDHMTKSNHDWEVPDRIDSIMSLLADRTSESCDPEDEYNFNSCEITVSNEFERATLELLSRIHSADYLAFVNELSKDLDRKRKQQLLENTQENSSEALSTFGHSGHVVPFTPMIQKKFIKEAMAKADGHSDTSFSAGSLKAARRAAGAVQHAVDCVLVGRNRNAFCVVRPPGHHAGINGLLSDAESCGFCLFNNVAAGAMHALSDEKHRPRCERCAIVDIDAHHGNGTEEIVRKCHDSGRLLFFSVHLYDYDKPKKNTDFEYKFYPGTGADDDVPHNVINVPIAPLWREKEVIKNVASGLCNEPPKEPRQTRLKTKAHSRVSSSTDLKNMANDNSVQYVEDRSEISNHSLKLKSQLPMSSPHPPHYLIGVGRLAYRRAIQHRLLPALRAFNPDLIIMSTGFDAARGDVGNARHFVNGTQAMGLDLEPEDYAWTSRKICEVADICCNGRVVSVLEGGYGRAPAPIPSPPLTELSPAQDMHRPLEKMFFSECAVHHLKGLVDPYCDI